MLRSCDKAGARGEDGGVGGKTKEGERGIKN